MSVQPIEIWITSCKLPRDMSCRDDEPAPDWRLGNTAKRDLELECRTSLVRGGLVGTFAHFIPPVGKAAVVRTIDRVGDRACGDPAGQCVCSGRLKVYPVMRDDRDEDQAHEHQSRHPSSLMQPPLC